MPGNTIRVKRAMAKASNNLRSFLKPAVVEEEAPKKSKKTKKED